MLTTRADTPKRLGKYAARGFSSIIDANDDTLAPDEYFNKFMAAEDCRDWKPQYFVRLDDIGEETGWITTLLANNGSLGSSYDATHLPRGPDCSPQRVAQFFSAAVSAAQELFPGREVVARQLSAASRVGLGKFPIAAKLDVKMEDWWKHHGMLQQVVEVRQGMVTHRTDMRLQRGFGHCGLVHPRVMYGGVLTGSPLVWGFHAGSAQVLWNTNSPRRWGHVMCLQLPPCDLLMHQEQEKMIESQFMLPASGKYCLLPLRGDSAGSAAGGRRMNHKFFVVHASALRRAFQMLEHLRGGGSVAPRLQRDEEMISLYVA